MVNPLQLCCKNLKYDFFQRASQMKILVRERQTAVYRKW